ncbi:MAG: [Fe-Fe] hydrogenase large subunit C-terminal domain-containing protein [Bacteroidales bacterium]
MTKQAFHHALKIDKDLCIGCANCMRVCPTEAIRVREGKANLDANRCIDCGECYRHCPVNAIIIEQDDFTNIHNFHHKVALVPSVFFGQFPEEIQTEEIHSSLKQQGFTHVFEVENSTEIVLHKQQEELKKQENTKPLISAFCPAIVRLIQVKFPSLIPNLLSIKPPLDISALYFKKKLIDQEIAADQIGVFYITQCAAKIAAVKSPVGEDESTIDGVINMDYLYNKVFTFIKQHNNDRCALPDKQNLCSRDILWSLTNGEKDHNGKRSLAIDGINNVMAILERVENEEMSNIDFLELRACDESCAGGVLTSGNRFLTVERMRNRASNASDQADKEFLAYKDYLLENITIGPVEPRSMMKLDNDLSIALRKMRQVQMTMERLPRVDCTVCGAPSCRALAEDIVQGKASINDCIFIQKRKEQKELMSKEESLEIMKSIWGKPKLDKNR